MIAHNIQSENYVHVSLTGLVSASTKIIIIHHFGCFFVVVVSFHTVKHRCTYDIAFSLNVCIQREPIHVANKGKCFRSREKTGGIFHDRVISRHWVYASVHLCVPNGSWHRHRAFAYAHVKMWLFIWQQILIVFGIKNCISDQLRQDILFFFLSLSLPLF